MERSDYETTRAVARKGSVGDGTPEKPYFVGIAGEHVGRIFPLEGLRELTIGRTSDCEIVMNVDDLVSRRHARLEVDDAGRVWLADLESTNGTLLNGREVQRPVLLRRGDRVYVGEATIFKFDYLSDEELERWQSAILDALTECYNRAYFDQKLDELFEMSRARSRPLSVVLFDVDHFKAFNDQHTHQAGDFVLQQVGAITNDFLEGQPVEGTAFRYGGEEFVILLPGCASEDAVRLAEGLRTTIAQKTFEFEGNALRVTISLGAATWTPGAFETPEQLVRAADEKLYVAKRSGRNRVVG